MKKGKKTQKDEQQEEMEQQGQKNPEVAEQPTDEKKELSVEEKLAEMSDKYLRLYSEFDNYRRRTVKERADLIKSAGKDILSDLLAVVDDFDRTIESLGQTKDMDAFAEGVKLVQHKFMTTLEKQGLEHFDSKGMEFDPEVHEAITKIPAPSADLKGKVVDVIEKGYKLNDKVLRYAKVVVGE